MLRKFWSDVRQPKITLLGSELLCRFRRSARMTLPKRASRQDGGQTRLQDRWRQILCRDVNFGRARFSTARFR
jgi:hypothetical protein